MSKITIAIDNGTSGSIGIITPIAAQFVETPTKEALHYSKKGNTHNRIDVDELVTYLANFASDTGGSPSIRAYIERPFTAGPAFINTMLLSARAFEATLIALEDLNIGHQVVDSKEWQSAMLPGVKGSAELKRASKLKGMQLYPVHSALIKSHGDADGLLMAHYFHGKP